MGYLVAAGLAPNLLFSLHAGAWVDRRNASGTHDRGRPRPGGADRLDPARLRVRRAHVPAHVRRRVPDGTLGVLFQVSYNPLFVALVPRDRFVEGGSIMHGSRALLYVAGPSIGGTARADLSAPVTLVVDACSYVVSALFLRSIDAEEPPPEHAGQGPRRRRRPLGVRRPDRPRRARRDGDDQLLQLRLLRALHPLRDQVARRLAGDARPRTGRRRGRRRPRRGRHRPRLPQDRHRSGVRARLRRLPGAAAPRAARRGAALGDPRLPLPRRVRLRASA